jgi:hypothetical protein
LSIIKAAIGQKVAHKGRIDPTWTNDHKNDDWFKFNVIQIGMVYNLALHFNTVDLVTDKQGVCWSVDFHQ